MHRHITVCCLDQDTYDLVTAFSVYIFVILALSLGHQTVSQNVIRWKRALALANSTID